MNFTSLLLGEAVSEPSGMLDAKDGFGAWRQYASSPPPHTLGRQGHNSSQWLGSRIHTPSSTALMSKVLIRDDGNGPKRWRMPALSASWCRQENKPRDGGCLPCLYPGAGRKTNRTLGPAFCWPRNWSLHIQLHASLLLTQGGLEGDALPEGL